VFLLSISLFGFFVLAPYFWLKLKQTFGNLSQKWQKPSKEFEQKEQKALLLLRACNFCATWIVKSPVDLIPFFRSSWGCALLRNSLLSNRHKPMLPSNPNLFSETCSLFVFLLFPKIEQK